MGLRHDAQDFAAADDRGTVVELALYYQRYANHGNQIEAQAGAGNLHQGFFCSLLQAGLQEQVAAGVGGYRQLRKHDQLTSPDICRLHSLDDPFCIISAVCHPKIRADCFGSDKSVIHSFLLVRSME